MSQFPSHAHLSSWAVVSPGNHESAGKRQSGRSTHGNKWLKSSLTESAWGPSRTKGSNLQARYHRLASRREKRAALALAHTLIIMAYHIVKERCTYNELGADYFDRLNEQYLIKRLTSRIETLGYHVTVEKEPLSP